MSQVTYFVALPFVVADDGIAPGETVECFNPTTAVMRTEALSRKAGNVGAVAFSRTGDHATGDFGMPRLFPKERRTKLDGKALGRYRRGRSLTL